MVLLITKQTRPFLFSELFGIRRLTLLLITDWVKGKVFEVDASLTIFQQRHLAVRMCAKQVNVVNQMHLLISNQSVGS